MTTRQNSLPNERQLVRNYWGTEASLGVFVPPTFKLYGDLRLTKTRPLADRNEFAGTRFKDYTYVRGPNSVAGTYAQALSYEDLPILCRYGLVGGSNGVDDANTVHGYTYTQFPTPTKPDIDFASVETMFPGLPMTATGLFHNEFTVSGDIDDAEAAWKWASNVMALSNDLKAATVGVATGGSTTTVILTTAGWTVNAFQGGYVRMTSGTAANIDQFAEIASNTATTLTLTAALPAAVTAGDGFEISGMFTPAIADRTRETIDVPGTQIYMDTSAALGTTLVNGRFISFSVTWANNAFGKRFMENTTGFSRYGFGAHVVTGQIRLEFDHRAEWDAWNANTYTKLRIKKDGTTIDPTAVTRKTVNIDLPNIQYDAETFDDREQNVTVTCTFRAYVDPASGVPAKLLTKNRLATLP